MMVFYVCAVISIATLLINGWTPWLLLSFTIHIVIINFFTVAQHRYYSHKAFEANEHLMFALSWCAGLFFYPSIVSYVMGHTAHHTLSDTDEDTHIRGWKGLFGVNHKPPPIKYLKIGMRLSQIKKHKWMHDNIVNVQFAFAALMFLILPLHVFLYAYIIPIFTMHLCGRLHTNISHSDEKPCNRWYLEYLLPFGGEWHHANHHDEHNNIKFGQKWYELDTGYWFSKLLIRIGNRK